MADFDFLDGFDSGGDWGFTGVASKPSDQVVSDSKATAEVVKQTADGVGKVVSGEIISRLETKLDKILREVSTASGKIDDKHEVELEIAKSQMDDEYDLRKDNLGKIIFNNNLQLFGSVKHQGKFFFRFITWIKPMPYSILYERL